MGRAPCCEKVGLKKGRWTAEEDEILVKYIQANGEGSWRSLPKKAGLKRCGKSCRLRWINYLRADLKRGNISAEEEEIIMKLHNSMGNRWSLIAGHLPGRTDNEIKNYWNSHLSRSIDCYRRPISNPGEAPPTLKDLSPKMGRSRPKMRSIARKSPVSNTKLVATEEIEKDTVLQDEVSVNKSIVSDGSEVGGEERESISSGCDKEGGSGPIMGPSESTEDLMLSPNEERQQEILGEEMEFDVLFLDEVLSENLQSNKDDDGVLMSSQCIKESKARENVEWYSFSPITSCFEEDWAKWDWESAFDQCDHRSYPVHKALTFDQCDDHKKLWGSDHQEENLELLYSWLWDSDHWSEQQING